MGAAASLLPSVCALVLAPLLPGIVNRTKAFVAGRRGASLLQPYRDIRKCLRRGAVYGEATSWAFRLGPVANLAALLAALLVVPLGGIAAPLSFAGDLVVLVGLLAAGRFATVLAALDTGSSFEGMGASRETTFASLVEPGLFIALAALGIASHDSSLSAMLGEVELVTRAPLVMVGVSLFALTLAECARVPVDDPSTHLELTMVHEVMVLDHSGPDLALILYAGALKLAVFAGVLLGVLYPAPRPGGAAALVTLLGSLLLLGVAIGVVESVVARLRLPKVPLYLVASSALGLFGLILLLR